MQTLSSTDDGPISATQKRLVQESFAAVAPNAEAAADLFYGRLFELDPSLRSLFKGDLKEQGRKLDVKNRTKAAAARKMGLAAM